MTTRRANSSRKLTDAKKAAELKQCWELRRAGHSVREIAAATKIPLTSVHRRLSEAFETEVSPARDEIRAWEDARLDLVVRTAIDIARDAEDLEVRLKALDRVIRASERRARMHGLDAPERVLTGDLQYDPNSEWGQVYLEELAAARAELDASRQEDPA